MNRPKSLKTKCYTRDRYPNASTKLYIKPTIINAMNKTLPEKWWNHNINPILGYEYSPLKSRSVPSRDKFEFPEEDDYKIFEED